MDNDSQLSNQGWRWRRWLASLFGLVLLAGLFYAEEDCRGWLAWRHCQRALEAKGAELEWNNYLPPPVPDESNFFKAPKMTAWFVRHDEPGTNELTKGLQCVLTPLTIAEFVILPVPRDSEPVPSTADIALRYSSFGTALFGTADAPAGAQIAAVEMAHVPLLSAIKALARQAQIDYLLDPKIGFTHPDRHGGSAPEPVVSVRWINIDARSALLALLNQCNLELVEDAKSKSPLITTKDPAAPSIYASASTRQQLEKVFGDKLQTIIRPDALAAQGFLLFPTNLVPQFKPVRIVLQSETMPEDKDMIAIMSQFFRNEVIQHHALGMRIERSEAKSLRVVVNGQTAADYLAWSDRFAPDFDLMREALKRPYARMDGDYARPADMPTPNYFAVRVVAQTLAQRAKSDLLLGQPDKALREITLLHELRHLLEAAPTGKPITLVAAMIDVAIAGLYVNTIAEGIQSRAWQEPQLAALQNQLAEIQLPPLLMQAFREEPAAICRNLETMSVSKWANWNAAQAEKRPVKANDWLFGKLWPHGWICQNMVYIAELYDNYQHGFDPAHATLSPREFEAATRAVDNFVRHSRLPYKFLAAIAIRNLSMAGQAAAHNQTYVNEARIACALERYHLVHGEYPATLAALVPRFIAMPPHDLIGGNPLIYRPSADGKFVLYSVGWDETDDGGLPVAEDFDYKGDWVWKK